MSTKTATKADPKAKAPGKRKGPPKPMGRPSKYTPELAAKVCAAISSGKTMRNLCSTTDMPAASTVYLWLDAHPDFSEQYARARLEAADALVEEILEISDDGTNDWMEVHDREGDCVGYRVNGEHVQRSRLRVDSRKWIASKLNPKKYGDKVDMSHDLKEGGTLEAFLFQLAGKTLKPVVE